MLNNCYYITPVISLYIIFCYFCREFKFNFMQRVFKLFKVERNPLALIESVLERDGTISYYVDYFCNSDAGRLVLRFENLSSAIDFIKNNICA